MMKWNRENDRYYQTLVNLSFLAICVFIAAAAVIYGLLVR